MDRARQRWRTRRVNQYWMLFGSISIAREMGLSRAYVNNVARAHGANRGMGTGPKRRLWCSECGKYPDRWGMP
jgi:hypothetical protein